MFCRYYNINVNQTVVFEDPEVDAEGILTLNLNNVRELAPRQPKKSKTADTTNIDDNVVAESFVLDGNG